MKRFFADKITEPITLRGEEHKHLSVVLRARVGEEVTLADGDGYDYVCRIDSIGRDETRLSLCRKELNESEPSIKVTLFMSVMKGDKNELVVQKAVELGVYDVQPLLTRFVQGYDRKIKTERLNKIALEAAKQCGRSVLTAVHEPIDFSDLAAKLSQYDLVVFPYERAQSPSLKEFLRGKTEGGAPKRIAVIVGSEGGFADDEVKTLTDAGVVPVTLGKRIMRAETANIAVLSAIMYETGQWQ